MLAALYARMAELDREDIYCAIKHVFQTLHPNQRFTTAEYRAIQRHYAPLARRHFRYRSAAQMLLRPLQLSPVLQSAATPVLALAGRLMVP